LFPSIGNWNLECKSHYWIRSGRVVWDKRWSDDRIKAGRRWETKNREEYYRGKREDDISPKETVRLNGDDRHSGFWPKIKSWLSR
jgi:hypothetical protein